MPLVGTGERQSTTESKIPMYIGGAGFFVIPISLFALKPKGLT